mgnify:CR=1 FL=1
MSLRSWRNSSASSAKYTRDGASADEKVATGIQGHTAYPHLADNPLPRLVKMLDALASTTLDDGTDHFQPSNLQLTTSYARPTISAATPDILPRPDFPGYRLLDVANGTSSMRPSAR